MTSTSERPSAYVGIGSVVGPDAERQLVDVAKYLAMSQSDLMLGIGVNATHAAQMGDRIDPSAPGPSWSPVGEAGYKAALAGGHAAEGVMSIARVQLAPESVANPGYRDYFVDRTLNRSASWADAVQINGFELGDGEQDAWALAAAKRVERFNETATRIVGFELPSFELLSDEEAQEVVKQQFARVALGADYIALHSKAIDIDAARALLDIVYATPDLDGVGFVIEDTEANGALQVLKEYPNVSTYTEHPRRTSSSAGKQDSLDIEKARQYVEAALRSVEALESEVVEK